jgi:hypothetical protein
MSIVETVETVVDGIAVFERGAWFAAVRVRSRDDADDGKLTVYRNFAFDDAHQAVRAARVRAAAYPLPEA